MAEVSPAEAFPISFTVSSNYVCFHTVTFCLININQNLSAWSLGTIYMPFASGRVLLPDRMEKHLKPFQCCRNLPKYIPMEY